MPYELDTKAELAGRDDHARPERAHLMSAKFAYESFRKSTLFSQTLNTFEKMAVAVSRGHLQTDSACEPNGRGYVSPYLCSGSDQRPVLVASWRPARSYAWSERETLIDTWRKSHASRA